VSVCASHPFCAFPSQSFVPVAHAVQTDDTHVCAVVHDDVGQIVPQLESRFVPFSQALAGEPSQSSVPLAHATHAPFVHVSVEAAQGTVALHDPVALHVWTPSPEHWVVFGTQTPEQEPPDTHADATHATGALHCPFASQVSTPLPEHCFAPGVQEPVQAPPTHA
jgi:hypothetical protein